MVFERENDAQMFRQASQCLDVLLDQLGRPVVVVVDGVDAINDGMVGLSYADVEGEEGVDDDVDEGVPLRLEEAPYAESRPLFPLLEFGSLCCGSGRRREVWLFWRRQQLLPRDKSPRDTHLEKLYPLFRGQKLVSKLLIAPVRPEVLGGEGHDGSVPPLRPAVALPFSMSSDMCSYVALLCKWRRIMGPHVCEQSRHAVGSWGEMTRARGATVVLF